MKYTGIIYFTYFTSTKTKNLSSLQQKKKFTADFFLFSLFETEAKEHTIHLTGVFRHVSVQLNKTTLKLNWSFCRCRSHTHKFPLLCYTCSNSCSYFIPHGYMQLLSKCKIRLLTLLAFSRSTYHCPHTPSGRWEAEQLTQKSQWDFNEINYCGDKILAQSMYCQFCSHFSEKKKPQPI